jgi:hypothetical protein
MNISFDCETAEVRSNGPKLVTVDCEKVIESEVLDNFKLSQIVDHFGISGLLNEIGQDACEKHFDLIPNE